MKKNAQYGMTLIELMIAMSLGLVLVAVAVQMFIASQSSLSVQRSLGDLQDNGLFGLDFIARDIRKANLGATLPVLDSHITQGGLILSLQNLAEDPTQISGFESQHLSTSDAFNGTSNFKSSKSDQLTIQYKTHQNIYDDAAFLKKINSFDDEAALLAGLTQTVGYDCEGKRITLGDVATNTYIIQRYFIRKDTTLNEKTPNQPLALACDAARYSLGSVLLSTPKTKVEVTDIAANTGGSIILRRVEHLHVLLGVATGDYDTAKDFRYLTLAEYALEQSVPKIRSIQLGVVLRAQDPIPHTNPALGSIFDVLDMTGLELENGKDHYMRQVLTQTIALRNALGEDQRVVLEETAVATTSADGVATSGGAL